MTKPIRKKAPNQLSPERELQLLDAAMEIFIENGLGGATTDLIAKRAGISKATLYRRYSSKDAMFEAVINREADRIKLDLGASELPVNDPVRGLGLAAQAVDKTIDSSQYTEVLRLMIAQASRHPELVLNARKRIASAFEETLVVYFRALIAAGKMRPVDPVHASNTFGIIIGGGFRNLLGAGQSRKQRAKSLEEDVALFIHGWIIDQAGN